MDISRDTSAPDSAKAKASGIRGGRARPKAPGVRAQFLRSSRAPASPSLMGRDRFAEALADAREQIEVMRKALDAASAARCAILVVDAVDAKKDAADAEKDAAPPSPRTLTFGTFSADPSQTPPLPSPTPSPPPPPAAAPAPRRQIKFDAALVPPPAVAFAPPPRPLPLRPAPPPRVRARVPHAAAAVRVAADARREDARDADDRLPQGARGHRAADPRRQEPRRQVGPRGSSSPAGAPPRSPKCRGCRPACRRA